MGGDKCIYRSSWELKSFKFLDENPKVLKWTSERVIIPYKSDLDGKIHRYFADLYAEFKLGNSVKKYLIEVKPYKKLFPPKESKRKKQSTIIHEKCEYAVNQNKWNSAKQYCKNKGYDWMIMTEKGLMIKDRFYNMEIFK